MRYLTYGCVFRVVDVIDKRVFVGRGTKWKQPQFYASALVFHFLILVGTVVVSEAK